MFEHDDMRLCTLFSRALYCGFRSRNGTVFIKPPGYTSLVFGPSLRWSSPVGVALLPSCSSPPASIRPKKSTARRKGTSIFLTAPNVSFGRSAASQSIGLNWPLSLDKALKLPRYFFDGANCKRTKSDCPGVRLPDKPCPARHLLQKLGSSTGGACA